MQVKTCNKYKLYRYYAKKSIWSHKMFVVLCCSYMVLYVSFHIMHYLQTKGLWSNNTNPVQLSDFLAN